MDNWNSSSPTLTNCTFSGNSADGGGGMDNASSSPALTNCILWGDGPGGEIYNSDTGSMPVVTYSNIQGGYEGDGNINADPLFLDTAAGDLRLQLASPAIDAGNNDAVPAAVTTDLGGNPRFADVPSVPDTGSGHPPIVDMGAYEAPPAVIFVDRDATGAGDGASWLNAFTGLQDALDEAIAPAQIWVAAGVYTPTVKYGGDEERNRSFQMANGVAIYGGFDPSVGDDTWGERDWEANPTILSGDLLGNDEPGFVNNGENSYHVFYHPLDTDLAPSARLDGFTITGGNADGIAAPNDRGGGMYNYSSSPTLINLTFAGNSATYGGGIHNDHSSPVLGDCTFSNNTADDDGGGMHNANNSAPVLTNCTFIINTATRWGGAMSNGDSNPTLTNVTMSGNSAGQYGDGIFNYNSSPALTNCILWEGDTSEEIHNTDDSSTPAVTYSDIQGGCTAYLFNNCLDGNIDDDPLFVDAASGDVHLGLGSPCIDAGKNSAPYLPAYDFEGHPRIMDGDRDGVAIVDMGVDEVFGYRVHLPVVLKGY